MRLSSWVVAGVAALAVATPAQAHTAPIHAPYEVHESTDLVPQGASGFAEWPVGHEWARITLLDMDDVETFDHERGHVWDWYHLRDKYRARFQHIFVALTGLDWWQPFGRDNRSPGEWFAEGYMRCSLHLPANYPSAYGYDPTPRQHRKVCRTIWQADGDRQEVY